MNIEVFRVALAITMMILSLGILALGIKVAPGKPFLLRTRIYLAGIVLIFAGPTVATVVAVWPPDQVTITPLGVAGLRFTKKAAIPNYKGLIASLDGKLRAKEYEGSRFSGCVMLVVPVVMMSGSIWLLLS